MENTSNEDTTVAGPENSDKVKAPGSQRGVETMLRSAYRTNLEMTALADNKANMLITVNGLILSVMIATGGLSIFAEATFMQILPILALATTSFITMVLAIMVARPRIDLTYHPTREDFDKDRANPFLFSHYLNLTQDEYLDLTYEVMRDRNRLYRHMVAHNYGMGLVLARKFKLVRWAYDGFVVGLGVSVLILILGQFSGVEATKAAKKMVNDSGPARFRELTDVYEPSAAADLGQGKIILFEDEAEHSWKVLDLKRKKKLVTHEFHPSTSIREVAFGKATSNIDDIEAAERDAHGNIYVLTSHSRREGDGELPEDRKRFFRFRFDGSTINDFRVATGLLSQLQQAYPRLAKASAEGNAKQANGLNIEALAIDPVDGSLLIGFRSPLHEDRGLAYLVRIKNPEQVFTNGVPMAFASKMIELDLRGTGIRGMSYIHRLSAFLIASGPANKGDVPFSLWLWSGEDGDQARKVEIEGMSDFGKVESVASVFLSSREWILFLSDDGDARSELYAQYLLLDPEELNLAAD